MAPSRTRHLLKIQCLFDDYSNPCRIVVVKWAAARYITVPGDIQCHGVIVRGRENAIYQKVLHTNQARAAQSCAELRRAAQSYAELRRAAQSYAELRRAVYARHSPDSRDTPRTTATRTKSSVLGRNKKLFVTNDTNQCIYMACIGQTNGTSTRALRERH
jgi:hypothetical protein